MSADRQNEPEDVACPPALARSLQALGQQHVPVPPSVDEAILGEARRHLAHARPRILRPWFGPVALAAAAAVIFALWVFQVMRSPSPPSPSAAVADVDRNGQVDILDAFKLARLVEAGQAGAFDLNKDGRVDRGDVEAVAAQAVRLEGGS